MIYKNKKSSSTNKSKSDYCNYRLRLYIIELAFMMFSMMIELDWLRVGEVYIIETSR